MISRLNVNKLFESIKFRTYMRLVTPYIIFSVLLVVGQIISPGYLSPGHLQSILVLAVPLGLMTIGETMVLLLGGNEIDISVGDQASCAMVISALLLQSHPLWLVILVILAQGLLFGALNGVGTRYLKIPALIMTYITGRLLYGLSIAITKGTAPGIATKEVIELSSFPTITIIWLLLSIVVIVILSKTVLGRCIYAIGDNPIAAHNSGIPMNLIAVIAYSLSGALGALSGLFLLGFILIPSRYGFASGYSLQAVVAAILGGVSAGRGNYIGAVGGVLVLTVLDSFFTIFNIPEAERMMLYGITLAIILLVYGRREKLRK
jgi:ribose transport system permease protein